MVNPVLERIYRTGHVEDANGRSVPCGAIPVQFTAGRLLYDFVRAHRPARTLEIGLGYGASALFICQAHRDNEGGRHTAIDPYQETVWQSIGRLNVERAALGDTFRFFAAPADAVLLRLHADEERFDFAFIDGSHLFDFILVDFFYIDRLLQIGGWMAFDDLWMPAVRKVVHYVLRNRAYRLVPVPRANRPPLGRWAVATARRVSRGRAVLARTFGAHPNELSDSPTMSC
jgi:predicted O-methyltransferase YrrM